VAFLAKQEMKNLTDRIRYKGRYYEIHSPWRLQDRHKNIFSIHVGKGYEIMDKFSAFTSDKQYLTIISTSDYRRYFLVAGKIQVNGYKFTFKENHRVDITNDYFYYPNFDTGTVEAAYNADCKCFCTLDLEFFKVAFFWKLSTNSNGIKVKCLNRELNWIEDMSIEIKNGSLSIIDENKIQLTGTRVTGDKEEYQKDVVITYDFSLGAIVSIE
jgi:hypothetical protein